MLLCCVLIWNICLGNSTPVLLAFLWLDLFGEAMFGDEGAGTFDFFNDER